MWGCASPTGSARRRLTPSWASGPSRTRTRLNTAPLGLINDAGVRINLVYNGVPHPGRNVLMDVPDKWTGYTHYAVLVDSIQAVLDWAERECLTITEGPVVYGGRRMVVFIRDPDGNVIEFDELLPETAA